jgi:hypothetical protein
MHAVAVELELVQPFRSLRRLVDQLGELRLDPTRQRRRFSALPSRERSHHQSTSHQKPYLTARTGLNSCLGPTSSMTDRKCEPDWWTRQRTLASSLGAMSNFRDWASAAVVGGLILLAPIIAFVVVVIAEMLGDLAARAGAPAIWPAVAGAMVWVLLRKFGGQTQTSRLGSEGA